MTNPTTDQPDNTPADSVRPADAQGVENHDTPADTVRTPADDVSPADPTGDEDQDHDADHDTADEDQDDDADRGGRAEDPRLTKARKDAANYRTRLRDAEADRDRLTAELNEATSALAATRRAQAADLIPGVSLDTLHRLGLDLSEHVADDGSVDLPAAREAARAIAADAGILPSTAPRLPDEGMGHGPTGTGNWLSDALR